MAYSEILYDVSGKIATVTLNRPEKLNAWTGIMEQEVRAALIEATDDDGVGVIILTGAGRGFCSGADMNSLNTLQQGASRGGRTSDSVRSVNNAVPGGLCPSPGFIRFRGPTTQVFLALEMLLRMRCSVPALLGRSALSSFAGLEFPV